MMARIVVTVVLMVHFAWCDIYSYAPVPLPLPSTSTIPVKGALTNYNDPGLSHAQNYIRYFDVNGAERFIPSSNEWKKSENEYFRAWCEQRYQTLQAEVDRLRADKHVPSSNILQQMNSLRDIISATGTGSLEKISSAFVSGSSSSSSAPPTSADIQRAQEKYLAIWKAERTKVMQAEDELKKTESAGGSINIKSSGNFISPASKQLQQLPQQQQLLQQQQHELHQHEQQLHESHAHHEQRQHSAAAAIKSSVDLQQRYPATIEDTIEVKKAREEHLKEFQIRLRELEAQKTQTQLTGIESQQLVGIIQSAPIQSTIRTENSQITASSISDTPEVIRAREEHLKIVQEAAAKATATQENTPSGEIIRVLDVNNNNNDDVHSDVDVDRELELERMQELERQREEMKLREMERLAEIERLAIEKRAMEEEQVLLRREEEQRREIDRKEELRYLQSESASKLSEISTSNEDLQFNLGQQQQQQQQQQQKLYQLQYQYTNPFLTRIAPTPIPYQGGSGQFVVVGGQSQIPFHAYKAYVTPTQFPQYNSAIIAKHIQYPTIVGQQYVPIEEKKLITVN